MSESNYKVTFADVMKKALHLGGTLFAVTAVTGLILGFVQHFTSIAISRAELEAKNAAFRNVMPDGKTFNAVEVKVGDEFITDIQKAENDSGLVGWCMSVSSKGYGGPVNFIVGITKDGTVKAINILNHSETPGLGAKSTEPEFYEQFNDKSQLPLKVVKGSAENPDEIMAISGATITSNAVTGGVNAAVEYWSKNLKGAE
jgi:electron transport complex protein RnfG